MLQQMDSQTPTANVHNTHIPFIVYNVHTLIPFYVLKSYMHTINLPRRDETV